MPVGKHTYGLDGIKCYFMDTPDDFSIGSFCSIAECKIFFGGEHKQHISTYPFHRLFSEATNNAYSRGKVSIGNDCWIGYGVTIMSGVRVADGTIIGVNTTITKDTEPYGVYGGVNRLIKYRYSKEQREALLRIKWWEWSDEKIRENLTLLQSDDIDAFILKHDNENK